MPERKDEEPVEFKVVDRRKFTSEGESRTDVPDEPAPPPEPPSSAPKQAAPPPEPPRPTAPPAAEQQRPAPAPPSMEAPGTAPEPATGSFTSGIQFEHLVMSLVTQAMLQLGLAARPGDLAPKPDLNAAHETIDLLGILQEK